MSLASDIEEAIIKIAASAIEAALKGDSDTALDDARFSAELESHRIANLHLADVELAAKQKAEQKLGGG
jgi:hypothetical protein